MRKLADRSPARIPSTCPSTSTEAMPPRAARFAHCERRQPGSAIPFASPLGIERSGENGGAGTNRGEVKATPSTTIGCVSSRAATPRSWPENKIPAVVMPGGSDGQRQTSKLCAVSLHKTPTMKEGGAPPLSVARCPRSTHRESSHQVSPLAANLRGGMVSGHPDRSCHCQRRSAVGTVLPGGVRRCRGNRFHGRGSSRHQLDPGRIRPGPRQLPSLTKSGVPTGTVAGRCSRPKLRSAHIHIPVWCEEWHMPRALFLESARRKNYDESGFKAGNSRRRAGL